MYIISELRHAVGQILQLEPGNLKGFSLGSPSSGAGSIGNSNFGNSSQITSPGGLPTLILPPGGLFGISGGVSGSSVSSGVSGSSADSTGASSGTAAGPIVVVEQNMVTISVISFYDSFSIST